MRRTAATAGALVAATGAITVLVLLVGPPAARAGRTEQGTPSPALVAEGRDLFLRGCASCHGADGTGTAQGPILVGVGAAAADFQLTTGRMPLTEAGQAQRKPPAYAPDQIDALVAFVASLGAGPAIPSPHPDRGDLADGGELYRINCAACHSSTGNGGALSYGRNAPALHAATPVQVAEAMRTGPGPMPVFGPDTLTDHQVDSIVRYVGYLDHPDDPGGLALGHVGPITEGLVAIVVGLGVLVLAVRWIEARA